MFLRLLAWCGTAANGGDDRGQMPQMQPGRPRSMATLRVGSLVLPLIASLIWGAVTYVDERQRAFRQAEENVALVRQYAERVVQTQTIMHDAALAHVRAQAGSDYLREEGFHRFLVEIERRQLLSQGIVVVGTDGRVAASSRSFPIDVTFGQRDYMDAIAGGAALFLDRMVVQPGGEDALVVAQPFAHDGFQGVIASAIAIEAMRGFLHGVAAQEQESASLLRDDGKLLVRNVPTPPLFLDAASPARQAISGAISGRYQAVAASDGVERLYAFSKLDGLPIYANFGVPLRLVQLGWAKRAAPVWLLLATVGLFSFVLSGLVERSMRVRLAHQQQRRLRQEAEARAEQQQQFMRELNHRVKNNLAMVDSLIAIQLRRSGQIDAQELRARIAAIADVHDLLYQAAGAQRLDLGELLERIGRSPALVPAERGIACKLTLERGISVDASAATPLALAVVELVTNAVKHAFPGRGGTIAIDLRRRGGTAELSIADDGVGMAPEGGRSSGIRIVEALVTQVGGEVRREDGNGTRWQITFPVPDPAPAQEPDAAEAEAPSRAAGAAS